MPPRVYIETTIPSFYHETRPQPEMIARRNWTRLWWDQERHKYELVTSAAVRRELGRAVPRKGAGLLEILADVAELALTEDVASIEREYIRRKVMPVDVGGDATHLAAASYYGCHFLLTWNCQRPPALPFRAVLPHRLSRSVRLRASRQRQQVCPHPSRQPSARLDDPGFDDTAGTA